METRQILIADTKSQRRYSIQTAATTLGELMDQMTAQGIDHTGMSFTEGITRTQLLGRDSLLPTNVMYKGQPTNNLVMLLTNTSKNIASGCGEEDRSRKAAYAIIKDWGKEAQEEIKEEFGRNYTMVTTENLWKFIDENSEEVEDENEDDEEEEVDTESPKACGPVASHTATVNWLYDGIKAMVDDNSLYLNDIKVLLELLEEYAARLKEEQPEISEEDIEAMIASL